MQAPSLLLLLTACVASTATLSLAETQFWYFSVQDGMSQWWINSKAQGPYTGCQTVSATPTPTAVTVAPWAMLNAYRSGGQQGVHWKYTNDTNDPECIANWNYYSPNGQHVIATVPGRTTTIASSSDKGWCGLPVYRVGGVQGKQWQTCDQ